MKILYIDCETTGTDPHRHGLIQLAQVIEIDGVVVQADKLDIKPFPVDEIDQRALDVTGVSLDDLKSDKRLDPVTAWRVIKSSWDQFVNKYDRNDKFILAGYNVDAFDQQFLRAFISKAEPNDRFSVAGSYIGHLTMDPLPVLKWMKAVGRLDIPNLKLQTICDHLAIQLEHAHDALADVQATRQLIRRVRRLIQGDHPLTLGGLRVDLDDDKAHLHEKAAPVLGVDVTATGGIVISGFVTGSHTDQNGVTVVDNLQLHEISLVENPSNPHCRFDHTNEKGQNDATENRQS